VILSEPPDERQEKRSLPGTGACAVVFLAHEFCPADVE